MKNLLLLEYFTSKSNLDLRKDQELIKEGLNIVNSIIKHFVKSKYIKKINLVINKRIKTIKSKKINHFFTNDNTTYIDILNKFNLKSDAIIIAPEIDKKSLELHSVLKDRCEVLGSSRSCLEIFSSKFKTSKFFQKYKLPVVKSYKNNLPTKNKSISKPDFGAGSTDIKILKNNIIKANYITQQFHNGIKGSFLMLCDNGKSKVICCNKQIVAVHNEHIKQIGCIIGGLENYRKEIEALGNKICRKFKGLYGLVGVDIVREEKKWLVLEINSRFTSAYCGLEGSYSNSTISLITDFYLTGRIKASQTKFIKSSKYLF